MDTQSTPEEPQRRGFQSCRREMLASFVLYTIYGVIRGRSSLNPHSQPSTRMFSRHHDADAIPEEPEKQIGEGRTDKELEELEDDSGDVNE